MYRLPLTAALLTTALAAPALAQAYQAPSGYAPAYPPGYMVTPQPTYPPPAYQAPAYQAPAYEAPAYRARAYRAPSYRPPAYTPPAPAYEQSSTTPPPYEPRDDYGANPGARPGNVIGTGNSLPYSNRASNIEAYDTNSELAPRLPTPSVGDDASPRGFLLAARDALQTGRTGEAQEALERAESRMLDRSVAPSNAQVPNYNPVIHDVGSARRALATGDYTDAAQLIDRALAVAR